jgi:Type IV secretion system pilin
MRRKLFTIGLAILSLVAVLAPLALPSAVFAASNPPKTNVFDPTILGGPLILCVGSPAVNTSGNNLPVCSNLCDLVAQIANIIYYAIAVVIWIITPILIAVGGIMIMLGGANPEMVGRGKKTITGAVWGVVIVLIAWLIVFTFISAFGKFGSYVGFFPGGQSSCSVSSNNNGNSSQFSSDPLM